MLKAVKEDLLYQMELVRKVTANLALRDSLNKGMNVKSVVVHKIMKN